jgi:hypothetical protein
MNTDMITATARQMSELLRSAACWGRDVGYPMQYLTHVKSSRPDAQMQPLRPSLAAAHGARPQAVPSLQDGLLEPAARPQHHKGQTGEEARVATAAAGLEAL